MSATVFMQPPPAGATQVICKSGTSYSPVSAGLPGAGGAFVAQADILDMVAAGWTPGGIAGNGGASGAGFGLEGNINVQFSAAGVGNAADTTDDTLFTYTLPANSLDAINRTLLITAAGKLAANGNNKQIKLWFGGTAIVVTGVVTGNAVGWLLSAQVVKTGANAQLAFGSSQVGATPNALAVPAALAITDTAGIIIKVTGASGTTGAAGDVLGQFFEINWMN